MNTAAAPAPDPRRRFIAEQRESLRPFLRSAADRVQEAKARLEVANTLATLNPSPAALAAVDAAQLECQLAVLRFRKISDAHVARNRRGDAPLTD